jgi:hypothetical protein
MTEIIEITPKFMLFLQCEKRITPISLADVPKTSTSRCGIHC